MSGAGQGAKSSTFDRSVGRVVGSAGVGMGKEITGEARVVGGMEVIVWVPDSEFQRMMVLF